MDKAWQKGSHQVSQIIGTNGESSGRGFDGRKKGGGTHTEGETQLLTIFL